MSLGRVDDGAGLGATAVVVGDDGAAAGAPVLLRAGRVVGHLVVELEVAVELSGDVELGHGERIDLAAALAAEGRALRRAAVAGTADVVAAAAAVDAGPTVVRGAAAEAVPVEAVVAAEAAMAEVAEVETRALLVGTFLLAVIGIEQVVLLLSARSGSRHTIWGFSGNGRGGVRCRRPRWRPAKGRRRSSCWAAQEIQTCN